MRRKLWPKAPAKEGAFTRALRGFAFMGGGGGESSDFKYVLIIMSTIREHIANFEKNRTYSELFI